jgi:hypothetical protein
VPTLRIDSGDPLESIVERLDVLKPGGEARIYDLTHWLWLPAQAGNRLFQLAAVSPFGSEEVDVVRWPGSVPALVMLRLRCQPLPEEATGCATC